MFVFRELPLPASLRAQRGKCVCVMAALVVGRARGGWGFGHERVDEQQWRWCGRARRLVLRLRQLERVRVSRLALLCLSQ